MKYFVTFFLLGAHMALAGPQPRNTERIEGWKEGADMAALDELLSGYDDFYLSKTWYWKLGLMGDWITPEGAHYQGLGLLSGRYLQPDSELSSRLSGANLGVCRSYDEPKSVLTASSLRVSLVVGSSLEVRLSDSLILDITYFSTYCLLKETWRHGYGLGLGLTF